MSNAFKGKYPHQNRDRMIAPDEEEPEEAVEKDQNKAYLSARMGRSGESKGYDRRDRSVAVAEVREPEITELDANRAYRSARLIGQSKVELPDTEADIDKSQVIVSPPGTNKTEWTDIDSIGGPPGEPGRGIPEGGFINQHLVKQSGEDYDTAWRYGSGSDPEYPPNGLKGAILRKVTGSDNHVDWSDPTGGDPQARPPSIDTNAVLNGGFF